MGVGRVTRAMEACMDTHADPMDTCVDTAHEQEEYPVSPRSAVHAWQRYYGMEPRSDSRLTERFARGEIWGTADAVARELVCTNFIFEHTLYGELSEDFFRAVAASLRQKYGLAWDATWKIARFYGTIALKLMMVSSSGIRMPDLVPFVTHADQCQAFTP